MNSLLNERRIARMLFTKAENQVNFHLINAKADGVDEEKKKVYVNAADVALEQLKKRYELLIDISDRMMYNDEYEVWWNTLSEQKQKEEQEKELDYSATYDLLCAEIQQMSIQPEHEKTLSTAGSDQSYSPQQFTQSLIQAFQGMSFGVSAEQLTNIISSMQTKRKQVNIPIFKGDKTFFEVWHGMILGEMKKAGWSCDEERAFFVLTLLDGMPKKECAALKDPSYQEILTYLEAKYGNVKLKIEQATSDIATLPNVTMSAKELDHAYTTLLAAWNYLLKKHENPDSLKSESWIFTSLVNPKMPRQLIREWELDEKKGKEEGSTPFPEDFESFLKKLYDAYQLAIRTEKKVTKSKEEIEEEKDEDKVSSAIQLTQSSGQTAPLQDDNSTSKFQGGKNTCKFDFCKGNHPSMKCFKFRKLDLEQRRDAVRDSGLCYRCLSGEHFSYHCSVVCSCGGKHHALCCPRQGSSKKEENKAAKPKKEEKANSEESLQAANAVQTAAPSQSQVSSTTILPTARVEVVDKTDKRTPYTLLFDSGSERSYVSSALVKRIRPKWMNSEEITYSSFGGGNSGKKERNIFSLSIATPGESHPRSSVSIKVIEIETIVANTPRKNVPKSLLEKINLNLADSYSNEGEIMNIDILIGLDVYWSLMKTSPPRILSEAPKLVAQESVFGWVVSGAINSLGYQEPKVSPTQLINLSDIPEEMLRNFWSLENLGIYENEEDEEDTVWREFLRTVKYCPEKCRYEVRLPWKLNKCKDLQDNFRTVIKHLTRLTNRLAADPCLAARYKDYFRVLEEEEMITEIVEEDSDNIIVYLTHRPVVREQSTSTKVRPVFNASLPGPNGLCLNDCLYSGPNLLPNVKTVLMRFRRWKVALNSDARKAFLHIGIAEIDQDALRFLLEEEGELRVMKFTRVTFGLTSSPFLLNATIKHHLSLQESSHVVQELEENLYVDDWLSGADSDEEAKEMYQQADAIMKAAGMTLAKWTSNHDIFDQDNVDLAYDDFTKVLGLQWSKKDDSFVFEGINVPSDIVITKRLVLSCIARIFDPLGLITPFVMTCKILFQDTWKKGTGWDEPLEEHLADVFKEWVEGLEDIKLLKIPRHYATGLEIPWNPNLVELNVYADASPKGFGCVVYITIKNENGDKRTQSLVMSKARVAPLKQKTLPRLELLGCLIAAQCVNDVATALKLPDGFSYHCWTDSMVALSWIKGDPTQWKTFVRNRCVSIQELVDPSRFHHIAGRENPADLITRGLEAKSLNGSKSEIWFSGPPHDASESQIPERGDGQDSQLVTMCVARETENICSPKCARLFMIERWSTLPKALAVVAWTLRFIQNARKKKSDRNFGAISHAEFVEAKNVLIKQEQRMEFYEEIDRLEQNKEVSKSSKLCYLNPVMGEDGLLRKNTRLDESKLSYSVLYPVILPKAHLARLFIRFMHGLTHPGTDTMISLMRNGYWIIGLRVLAKGVKKECLSCQIQDSRPLNEIAAPLPRLRVTEAPVFSVCGVDYGGPLYCIDQPGKKLYVCLFTCGIVRAVHCELTDSLSLPDFMLAVRRLSARRGRPTVFYSDNAKTFVGAERALLEYFGPEGPEWRFIAPLSPWWGGWWERLMRSMKSGLRKTIGKRSLTYAELVTILQEVEAMVNSRPLTFVGDSPDSPRSLSPNHFLLGNSVGADTPVLEEPITTEVLNEREQLRLKYLQLFWKVWSQDYLRNLPVCVPGFQKKGSIKVGTLVLIRENDFKPRLQWPLGVVTKLHSGKDELPRAADVKTKDGLRTRDIRRLYNLEICSGEIQERIDELPGADNDSKDMNNDPDPALESSASDDDDLNSEVEIRTRYGRTSKKPDRYVP